MLMKYTSNRITEVLTKNQVIQCLKEAGLKQGMIVEVHCSLSFFDYVIGGAKTMVDALTDVLGYNGTILMSTQTLENSEPTYWKTYFKDYNFVQIIRDNLPAFDKKETDSSAMGSVVDNLRRRDGTVVSNHPTYSFIAWGKYAKLLCNRQSLHFGLSEESPLARLCELKGSILLLGVDYQSCTAFHLAQYRAECQPIQVQGAMVEIEGEKKWKKMLNVELDNRHFNEIGTSLEKQHKVTLFKLGKANCRLFRADWAMEEATRFFMEKSLLRYYSTYKNKS